MNPCHWRRRLAALIGASLLLAQFTGCVGREAALRMNANLREVSDQAVEKIGALKDSAAAGTKAHRAAQLEARKFAEGHYAARRKACEQSLAAAYQKTLAEINMELARLLGETQELLREKQAALEPSINAAMKPLYDKIAAYRDKANLTFNEFKADPHDLKLRERVKDADKDYISAQGQALDIKLDAYKAAIAQLNEAQTQVRTRLLAEAEKHRAQTTELLKAAQESLPASPPEGALPELPEPVDTAPAYDELADYAKAVRAAAKANEDYLKSNSFGAGSFFDSALRSFFRGFTRGVLNPASVRDASFRDVKDAGQSLLDDALLRATKEFAEAKSTFTRAANEAATSAGRTAETRALDFVTKFINDKLARLGGGQADNPPK